MVLLQRQLDIVVFMTSPSFLSSLDMVVVCLPLHLMKLTIVKQMKSMRLLMTGWTAVARSGGRRSSRRRSNGTVRRDPRYSSNSLTSRFVDTLVKLCILG